MNTQTVIVFPDRIDTYLVCVQEPPPLPPGYACFVSALSSSGVMALQTFARRAVFPAVRHAHVSLSAFPVFPLSSLLRFLVVSFSFTFSFLIFDLFHLLVHLLPC